MRKQALLVWPLANALGLAFGFFAILQSGMLIEFGLNWEMHWNWIEEPVSQDARPYLSTLVGFLAGGFVFGLAQGMVIRTRNIAVASWVIASATGFGAIAVVVDWPLIAFGALGIIPGPVEPIIATIGGGSLAGIFQFFSLRRHGIHASTWLTLWIVGLIGSLVPMVIIFIALDELDINVSWPTEVLMSGFIVGAVASLVSGSALFSALPEQKANPENV